MCHAAFTLPRRIVGVLSSQQIRTLIEGPDSLVNGFLDLEEQLQPNGLDLTLASIEELTGPGRIGRSNAQRVLAPSSELAFDDDGYVQLKPGPYIARLNEAVRLPADVMAIAKPRSSLLRSGVAVHNAVWDAGYAGRSQVQVVVYNPSGFSLARDARIVQMVFLRLEAASDQPYKGQYQGEYLTSHGQASR